LADQDKDTLHDAKQAAQHTQAAAEHPQQAAQRPSRTRRGCRTGYWSGSMRRWRRLRSPLFTERSS